MGFVCLRGDDRSKEALSHQQAPAMGFRIGNDQILAASKSLIYGSGTARIVIHKANEVSRIVLSVAENLHAASLRIKFGRSSIHSTSLEAGRVAWIYK